MALEDQITDTSGTPETLGKYVSQIRMFFRTWKACPKTFREWVTKQPDAA